VMGALRATNDATVVPQDPPPKTVTFRLVIACSPTNECVFIGTC
jgi:hypothetical protein